MVSRDNSNNNDNDNQNEWEQSNFLNMVDLIQNINMIYQQFVDQIKEITELQKQTLSAITPTMPAIFPSATWVKKSGVTGLTSSLTHP